MKQLIDALLNDDNGISEGAYNALISYLEDISNGDGLNDEEAIDTIFKEAAEAKELLDYIKRADATDGRFYFPSESE